MKYSYVLSYERQRNDLEINAFIKSLASFNNAITTINDAYEKEDSHGIGMQINVTALQPGSFEVGLMLQAIFPPVIAAVIDTMPRIPQIIDTLANIINLKEFLGGKKPNKIDYHGNNVAIYNNCHVYNISQSDYKKATNPAIDDAINECIQPISEISDIHGISLKNSEKEIFAIPQQQFINVIQPIAEIIECNNTDVEKKRTVSKPDVTLRLQSAIFTPNYVWRALENHAIESYYLKDNEFQERINKGETFRKGDVLICDLAYDQYYDEALHDYVTKKRFIVKVKQHRPAECIQQNNWVD